MANAGLYCCTNSIHPLFLYNQSIFCFVSPRKSTWKLLNYLQCFHLFFPKTLFLISVLITMFFPFKLHIFKDPTSFHIKKNTNRTLLDHFSTL